MSITFASRHPVKPKTLRATFSGPKLVRWLILLGVSEEVSFNFGAVFLLSSFILSGFLLIGRYGFLLIFVDRQDGFIFKSPFILDWLATVLLLLLRIVGLWDFGGIKCGFVFIFSLLFFFEVICCSFISLFLEFLLTLLFLSLLGSVNRLGRSRLAI